jgi:UDPglucose 6-dehydrogenase
MEERPVIIGCIGVGFVGQCVANTFANKFKVLVHDIKLGTKIDSVLEADIIFVNVPTPTVGESQDYSIVENVLWDLDDLNYKGVVVVKSTVLPGKCSEWQSQVKFSIVHNPEFLTERNAQIDFDNQECVLLSGNAEAVNKVSEAYLVILPNTPVKCYEKFEVTELAKYTHNCFLAIKVAFMNEMYDMCEIMGCSYDQVIDGALSQKKILPNHTKVPGPDGQRGFGGTCFPKDSKALRTAFKDKINVGTLSGAIESNKIRRPN